MSLRLITGHTGTAHVTAADDAVIHELTFGKGSFVFDRGEKFAASIVNSNTVRVQSGDASVQGFIVRQNTNIYQDLSLASGSAGRFRKDLIVIEYSVSASTDVGTAILKVLKGTDASSLAAAVDPEVVSADVTEAGGAKLTQFPLWRIPISGITPGTPEQLFEVRGSVSEIANNLVDLIYPVGSIYMSANDIDPSTLFGGVWARVSGKFLLGASSDFPAGTSGGASGHTLSISEMPSHTHGIESATDQVFVQKLDPATGGGSVTNIAKMAGTQTANTVGHTHTARTTGGGREFSIMPPYLSVYIWKRAR